MAGSFISALKAGLAREDRPRQLQTIDGTGGSRGFLGVITESFAGAWARNISVDAPRDILAFSAVFRCVTLIASDIGKLVAQLMEETDDEILELVGALSPYWPVLRKPNAYQNRIEFIKQYIVSKLLWGNVYVLKQRDARGIVTAMHVLDPQRVTTLITDSGDVYYRLSRYDLAQIPLPDAQQSEPTAPASEIIHDKMTCLWHPLVGVSPIYACGMSATMGNRIQKNSTRFFDNMSMPSGILTSDQKIDAETAARMKSEWNEKYGNRNIGSVAVLGAGLKFDKAVIPSRDAQLIEQLKWTVEDVARCFGVPLYKIGAALPSGASLAAQQQDYVNTCLHELIESFELCMNEGLELPSGYCVHLDEEGLLRMDKAARYDAYDKGTRASVLAPNEARKKENLRPVEGGDSPMAQQQQYSLSALAKRDALPDPFAAGGSAKPALPAPREPATEDEDDGPGQRYAREVRELLGHLSEGLNV